MGKGLKERDGFRQATDVAGLVVPEDEFTRPLWGVGDTGPWLHHGHADRSKRAILLHRSEGSEANDVIDAFTKLPSWRSGRHHQVPAHPEAARLIRAYDFDDYR